MLEEVGVYRAQEGACGHMGRMQLLERRGCASKPSVGPRTPEVEPDGGLGPRPKIPGPLQCGRP
eukprot:7574862-Pyramimonas_sp.AAC.1